jgi:hypothetical protein
VSSSTTWVRFADGVCNKLCDRVESLPMASFSVVRIEEEAVSCIVSEQVYETNPCLNEAMQRCVVQGLVLYI